MTSYTHEHEKEHDSGAVRVSLIGLLKNKNAVISVSGRIPKKERQLIKLRNIWLTATVATGMAVASVAGVIGNTTADSKSPFLGPILTDSSISLISPTYEQAIEHERLMDPLMGTDLQSNPNTWAKGLMEEGHGFLALTAQIEAIAEKPYWDNCGVNVGVGYCIGARKINYGEAQVRSDLIRAGLPSEQADILISGTRREQSKVRLYPEESLRLLFLTQGDYTAIARDAIGASVFDKLPEQKQQALSWMAYNLGDGLHEYKRLIVAVQEQDWGTAMSQMTPHYKEDGVWKRNNRAASYVMAVFASEGGLSQVLSDPDAFESAVRRGVSPVEIVNPKLAFSLKKQGKLPPSPYVVGDTLEDTRKWRVAQGINLFSQRELRNKSTNAPSPMQEKKRPSLFT